MVLSKGKASSKSPGGGGTPGPYRFRRRKRRRFRRTYGGARGFGTPQEHAFGDNLSDQTMDRIRKAKKHDRAEPGGAEAGPQSYRLDGGFANPPSTKGNAMGPQGSKEGKRLTSAKGKEMIDDDSESEESAGSDEQRLPKPGPKMSSDSQQSSARNIFSVPFGWKTYAPLIMNGAMGGGAQGPGVQPAGVKPTLRSAHGTQQSADTELNKQGLSSGSGQGGLHAPKAPRKSVRVSGVNLQDAIDGATDRHNEDVDLDFETAVAILVSSFPDLQPESAGSYLVEKMESVPLSAALELATQHFRRNTVPHQPPQNGLLFGDPSAGPSTAGTLPIRPAPNGAQLLFPMPVPQPTTGPQVRNAPEAQGTHQSGPEPPGSEAGPSHRQEAEDPDFNPFECKRLLFEHEAASVNYCDMCMYQLSSDFPRLSFTDMRRAFSAHGDRIGPTHRALKAEYGKALAQGGDARRSRAGSARRPGAKSNANANGEMADAKGRTKAVEAEASNGTADHAGSPSGVPVKKWAPHGLTILVRPRPPPKRPGTESPMFARDWAAVLRAYAREQEKEDEAMARQLNKAEYEEEGQHIECGCCCGDFPFEEMVQCADGHLFCYGCVRRRVEESTFGGLQACGSLPCMDTQGCTETFPPSEVRRALPQKILEKYEQRQADDSVARAELEGLVFCPSCNCPVDLDADQTVLNCPNEKCGKSSCRLCREPRHNGQRCEEVEKKDETDVRKRVEELMSRALIRECSKCQAEVVKADGCNKVVCRCGQAMCYVCRAAIPTNYSHFCQHARNPGQGCTSCKKCSLWVQENEEEVAREAREGAISSLPPELQEQALSLFKRPIGPKEDEKLSGKSKKRKQG